MSMTPEGWAMTSLGDLASLNMGQSPSSSACNEVGLGLPFFQGNAEFGSRHPVPKRWIETPLKIAETGDILFSVRAPVGEMNTAKERSCIGRGLAAIRPLRCNSEFLFYCLLQSKACLGGVSQGSTFSAVNKNDLAKLALLLPPLPEQKRIATILGSVDEAIQATQAVIDQTRKVKQGLLQQLFTRGIGHTRFKKTEIGEIPEGWEVRTTGDTCSSIVPGRNKPKVFGGDIPWITIPDIDGFSVSASRSGLGVSRSELAKASGKTVPKDTVIMTCVGKFGIAAVARCELVINQQLHGFVCGPRILPAFLCLVLRTKGDEMGMLAGQTTIPYLNSSKCESVRLPMPPLHEQEQIVNEYLSLEDAEIANEHNVRVLCLLKNGLMQDLLTGRVRVKGVA